jgi:hypothetical protein
MTILAILGGGDWYDASVDHLKIPEGRDVEADIKSYPKYDRDHKGSLMQWLIDKYGYEQCTTEELIIQAEDD